MKEATIHLFKRAAISGLSLALCLGMLTYGIGKVTQFTGTTDPTKLLVEFTPMELMWAFYRYSQPYVYIIGIVEVLGGIMVVFKRTRLAGCLLLTTILVNIILQDIFYEVLRGALVTAVYYQFIVLILMLSEWEKLTQLVKTFLIQANYQKVNLSYIGLTLVCFITFRVFEYFLTMKWLP